MGGMLAPYLWFVSGEHLCDQVARGKLSSWILSGLLRQPKRLKPFQHLKIRMMVWVAREKDSGGVRAASSRALAKKGKTHSRCQGWLVRPKQAALVVW